MTWVDVQPRNPTPSVFSAPVVVSTNPPTHRYGQRLIITVRTEKLEGGLPFWVQKAAVKVQTGTGEHHGKLRILPNGPHRLAIVGGRGTTVSLQIPFPAGVACDRKGKTAVEFAYNDGWIEITLPVWAVSRPGTSAVASQPEVRPHGVQVYRTAATNGTAPRTVTGGP